MSGQGHRASGPRASCRMSRIDLANLRELEVAGKKKDHPSISDYYRAAARGDKPIQYQHGLSNFSSVRLGDDRISVKKSMSQDAYGLDIELAETMTLSKLSQLEKSHKQRRADYAEANSVVGPQKIHEMEQMMRDKLQQRTKTGPFQLRKTFKYFDRDGSGGIDFSEFQRAMELMGFQFTDMQQLALFARYDVSCAGDVDYNDFVEKVMESDFKRIDRLQKRDLETMISCAFGKGGGDEAASDDSDDSDDSEVDEEERERFTRMEVKRLFGVVDKDCSGFIDRDEVETLLKSLGRNFSEEEVNEGFQSIDTDSSGQIEFDEFYNWYRTVTGAKK